MNAKRQKCSVGEGVEVWEKPPLGSVPGVFLPLDNMGKQSRKGGPLSGDFCVSFLPIQSQNLEDVPTPP